MYGLLAATTSNSPTAGGLSTADLIAILAIMTTIFGLLLTAIGVLVLRQFTDLSGDLQSLRHDTREDIRVLRESTDRSLNAVWIELRQVSRNTG